MGIEGDVIREVVGLGLWRSVLEQGSTKSAGLLCL